MVVVRGSFLLVVFILIPVVNFGKRVRLTRKTRPGVSLHSILDPDLGHPTPRRWKRLRPPLPPNSGGGREGVRWASLAIFFLDLGLGEAGNLPS